MRPKNRDETIAHYVGVQVVAFGVLFNGVLLIISTLLSIMERHHFLLHKTVVATGTTDYATQLYLGIGLTLIYLAILLWRRKQTAWLVALLVYGFYLGISFSPLLTNMTHHRLTAFEIFRNIVLPLLIVAGLVVARKAYKVRSDIRSFSFALRIIIIVLLIAFCYGIAGFILMDKHDFHQEVGFWQAVHRTIDQFGLTTNTTLVPYTRRARLFLDSLNLISVMAVVYALIALFQPLKARLEDQTGNREEIRRLLEGRHAGSEDFFKLWPEDKHYFFNHKRTAGIVYKVHRGIALVVGDPFGAVAEFPKLLEVFGEYCRLNDWVPSFIHTEEHFNPLYEHQGYTAQKIGEEAVVNADHFISDVATNKYFRNIKNKFEKQGFKTEILSPPHHAAVIQRLRAVSDDWISQPGRAERGFMMGYFTPAYMQLSTVMVLRDQAGTIQAFLNQIPSYDKDTATYDLLRHTAGTLSNSTDYLLMEFIGYAHKQGYEKVNLGLCPLTGLNKDEENKSIIDSTLRFAYSNGDRIYSFSGLYKFKQKYEPDWSPRFIVYKNGIRGFTRTLTALNVAMKVRRYKVKKRRRSLS